MCVCVCVSICALILNHYKWLLTSLHSYAHTISTLRVYRLSCSYRTESYLCQYLPSEQPSYIISRNKVGDTFSFLHLHCPPPSLSLFLSPSSLCLSCSLLLPGTWTVDSLSGVLEAQPSVVRRHLGFWVGQGVLKESPTDTFTVVEEQQEGARPTHGEPQGLRERASLLLGATDYL